MLGLASMHVTHLVTPVTIGRIRHLSRNNKHVLLAFFQDNRGEPVPETDSSFLDI